MRKIIYWVHTSLDGYINGPNGEFDWPVLGPELSAYSFEIQDHVDTLLYGRRVWELMSSYWPDADANATDEHTLRFAPIWRATPKVVFSRTLREAGWNARLIGDNLADEVTALKQQQGRQSCAVASPAAPAGAPAAGRADLLLTGGAEIAAVLTRLGLIDDIRVVVHPVVLGGGMRLFPGQTDRVKLRLVGSRTFDGQTVLLHYQPE